MRPISASARMFTRWVEFDWPKTPRGIRVDRDSAAALEANFRREIDDAILVLCLRLILEFWIPLTQGLIERQPSTHRLPLDRRPERES